MNYIEFSQSIKNKYPQYKNVDDLELANKMIAKYPEYSEQVTFDEKITTTPEEIVQEPTRLASAMQAIKGFGGPESFLGPEELAVTPREAVAGVAKVAPYAALPFTGIGLAGQAGITGVSRVVEGLAEEERLPEALKAGAIAAGTESAIGRAVKLAKPLAAPVKKLTKEATAYAGNILSSVPRESIEKALDNPKILKTKDTFTNLGNKAKEGLQKLLKENSARKKQETRILKKSEKELDLGTFVNRQKKLIEAKAGKQDIYTEQEKIDIKEILDRVKGERNPVGLRQIMDEIDSTRGLYRDPITRAQRTGKGDTKLKEISRKIRSRLKTDISGIADIREQSKEVIELKEILGKKLAKTKDAGKLLTRKQDAVTTEALEKLDDLLPEKDKFLDRAQNVRIKEQFSEVFPGRGGGTGNVEGIANLLRVGLGVTTGGATLPLTSPVIQRAAISALPGVTTALETVARPLPKVAAKAVTPIQRQESGSLQPQSLEEIKQERRIK